MSEFTQNLASAIKTRRCEAPFRFVPSRGGPQRAIRESGFGRPKMSFAPAIVSDIVHLPGRPLDTNTRTAMESSLGHDFSSVRVHSDDRAAASARALDALAYTVGRNIVFGAGQYAPTTRVGRRLLAHELTHTVQQQGAGLPAGSTLPISNRWTPGELEADRCADAFSKGETVNIGIVSGVAIQRQPLTDSPNAAGDQTLVETASPLLAAALGSTTLDYFEIGRADLKPDHQKQLSLAAGYINVLMRKYDISTITVVGHADTVGMEGDNLSLGQERADIVKRTLAELGLPNEIISAESKGEAAPQAVKTPNEIPSGPNRRVEIHFHPKASGMRLMTSELKLPSSGDHSRTDFDPVKKPPIDLEYRPPPERYDPTKLDPNFWKPIPPLPKGIGSRSVLDVLGEKFIDPVVDAVAGRLPKNLRDKIKDAARDAVKSGVAKGARAAAETAGISDSGGLDAIEKAAEAAIQEKGKLPQ